MTTIRWGRAIAGGILGEILVFALVIPVYLLFGEAAETLYAIPPASFAGPFVLALWVGTRIETGYVAHGTIVGVVAVLVFLAITAGQPQSWMYWFSHGLKILGGVAGGYLAATRAARRSLVPV